MRRRLWLIATLVVLVYGCSSTSENLTFEPGSPTGMPPQVPATALGRVDGYVTAFPDGSLAVAGAQGQRPAANVTVRVEGGAEQALTDDRGYFSLSMAAGSRVLGMAAPSGKSLRQPVTVVSGATVRLGSARLTRLQAVELATKDLARAVAGLNVTVYASQNPLPARTRISGGPGPDGTVRDHELTEPAWLFYLDAANQSGFAHVSFWLLVADQTSEMRGTDRVGWPRVNDVSLWEPASEAAREDVVLFQAEPELPVAGGVLTGLPTLQRLEGGRTWLIAVRGSNEPAFEDSVQALRHILKPVRSVILRQRDLGGVGYSLAGGRYQYADKALRAAFLQILPELKPEDEVVFYFVGHQHGLELPKQDPWEKITLGLADLFLFTDRQQLIPARLLLWDTVTPPAPSPEAAEERGELLIRPRDIVGAFVGIPACRLVILLDCCYARAFNEYAFDRRQDPSNPLREGIRQLLPPTLETDLVFASDELTQAQYPRESGVRRAKQQAQPLVQVLVPTNFMVTIFGKTGTLAERTRQISKVSGDFTETLAALAGPSTDRVEAREPCPCSSPSPTGVTPQPSPSPVSSPSPFMPPPGGSPSPSPGVVILPSPSPSPGVVILPSPSPGVIILPSPSPGVVVLPSPSPGGGGGVSFFPDQTLQFTHVVGQSPCPQRVGAYTLQNDSSVPATFSLTGIPFMLTVSPTQGSLSPGSSQTLEVFFNCATNQSFGPTPFNIRVEFGGNSRDFTGRVAGDLR